MAPPAGDGQLATIHPLAAVAFSALVYLLVLGGATLLSVIQARSQTTLPGVPPRPVYLVFVALIVALSGVGAVCLARWNCSLYGKSGVAIFLFGWLVGMLVKTLESSPEGLLNAQAWAAGAATQIILTLAVVKLLELSRPDQTTVRRSQFGILHLLFGLTVVAVLLGAARYYAQKQGFTLATVLNWDFFWQIQAAGIVGASLAVATYACLRFIRKWTARMVACGVSLMVMALTAPLAMLNLFGTDIGATWTSMSWLFACEGLFLWATLVPLEALREYVYISK
jgi:hypothetical protein